MSTYSSPEQLRDHLAIDEAALSDERAELLLADAEDLVDRLIGAGGAIDPTTGRSLRPATLVVWRRDKLARATNTLAGAQHADPEVFQVKAGQNIKGPDFEVSGSVTPRMSAVGLQALRSAVALLDSAALRRLTARTTR